MMGVLPEQRKARHNDKSYSVAAWRRILRAREVMAMVTLKRLVAVVLVTAPLSCLALAPAIAALIKQMVQQAVTSSAKDMLIGSLRDMGCKGIALGNALTALDARGGTAGLRGMAGMQGMQPMAGMPNIANMLPPGTALPPEQAAMLAQLQGAMAQPLTPAQTLVAMDDMVELGLLPRPVQNEMKECMTLLPQTAPALGSAMGMLQPMLPQLREAREQMRALSPAEQDEFAAMMAQELKAVPAGERQQFVEQLDAGFFPPAVAAGVKARLGAK
jgi:hypothetical protein